ncbi:MAG: response regulator [Wenzhouxiangellaceae bacterium]|nr:response regulator [Wenzhouxiangellaceae bacterium]
MIKVIIVEDHVLVRSGLANIIDRAGDMRVVGEASSGEQALRLNLELEPDIVLMDIGLPGMSGVEATERILRRRPAARVIGLTARSRQPYPLRLLDSGASGYLTKGCDAEELLRAVRDVAGGKRYIGAEIAQQLASAMLPGGETACPFSELTSRELEVALMLARGLKPRAIAERIHISPKTVSTHKYRIYEKLGVRSEVDLLRAAIRHEVLPAEE